MTAAPSCRRAQGKHAPPHRAAAQQGGALGGALQQGYGAAAGNQAQGGLYGGMATSVGRLRVDESGLRYMLVSHNTKMGAAKGAVLVAEHLAAQGYC